MAAPFEIHDNPKLYHSIRFPPVPDDTARLARIAFGKGNIYLSLGDNLDRLLFELIPVGDGRLASQQAIESFIRSALLTIFQYTEELTNRQIVEAARSRVELKYALHLPLNYPSFNPDRLCEFRRQLMMTVSFTVDETRRGIFQTILDRAASFGLVNPELKSTDADEVLAGVCTLTRLEEVVEAFYQALEALAISNPGWLRQVALPYWYDRYTRKARRSLSDNSDESWKERVLKIGEDIQYLLKEIAAAQQPDLAALPEITRLMHVREEQFEICSSENTLPFKLQWRFTRCATCSQI